MYGSRPDGTIILLAIVAIVALIVFGPWVIRRLMDPIADAANNADKRRQNQSEGDNLDYVANHFRDVGLPQDLKAAIDKVPNRPPLPGDRLGVVSAPQTGMSAQVAETGASPTSTSQPQVMSTTAEAPASTALSGSASDTWTTQSPSVTPSFCGQCGNVLRVGASFCSKCGAPIVARVSASQARASGVSVAQPQPESTQPWPARTQPKSTQPQPMQPWPSQPQPAPQGEPGGSSNTTKIAIIAAGTLAAVGLVIVVLSVSGVFSTGKRQVSSAASSANVSSSPGATNDGNGASSGGATNSDESTATSGSSAPSAPTKLDVQIEDEARRKGLYILKGRVRVHYEEWNSGKGNVVSITLDEPVQYEYTYKGTTSMLQAKEVELTHEGSDDYGDWTICRNGDYLVASCEGFIDAIHDASMRRVDSLAKNPVALYTL